jgi:DNA-binding transcriptional ArsR family regulator
MLDGPRAAAGRSPSSGWTDPEQRLDGARAAAGRDRGSQPGTSKHLRTLREAGLVRVRADAQRRVYELEPGPLAELNDWLVPYRRFWDDRLDALGRHLDHADSED